MFLPQTSLAKVVLIEIKEQFKGVTYLLGIKLKLSGSVTSTFAH